MKCVLLNALNIRSGGGLQKVTGFLRCLSGQDDLGSTYIVIARAESAISKLCQAIGLRCHLVRDANVGRLGFELSCRKKYRAGSVCFNLGGLVPLRGAGYFLNLSECAFSNLFYPEVNFWLDCGWLDRAKRELIDSYRCHAIVRSDSWIFQTNAIRRRAVELCGFPENRTCVVPPTANALVSRDSIDASVAGEMDRQIPRGFRFLFLNGAQPNKRIHVLPQIAAAMIEHNCTDFCFVSTMPREDRYTASVVAGFEAIGLGKYFYNIGPIQYKAVSSVMHIVDAVCTFSRLESFSNNFVEAWKMERPLVATDADWARESCGTAALYVDPERSVETAELLCMLVESADLLRTLVEEGRTRLARCPTPTEKTQLYLRYIERAKELGPCPSHVRARIRWPKVRRG